MVVVALSASLPSVIMLNVATPFSNALSPANKESMPFYNVPYFGLVYP